MPDFKLALLGYQDRWEMDRVLERAPTGIEIAAVPRGADADEVRAACDNADMIIGAGLVRGIDWARPLPKLKLVQVLSAGTDYLPVARLAEMGVRVANNGGGNAVAVAEVAIALMVSAYRQLMVQWRQLSIEGTYASGFEDHWERFHELTGKRVGIVGLGRIGSRVAKRLAGWECEIVYHDTATIDPELEKAANATRVGFDELLSTSDVVTLHVPLDKSTSGMMSDREFGLMKPGAILINTCRGPVVDEAALIRALKADRIAGAGLDVTEIEPIEMDNPLIKMRNVVLLPHRAGTSIEAREKGIDFAIHNATLLAAGKEPESIILPV